MVFAQFHSTVAADENHGAAVPRHTQPELARKLAHAVRLASYPWDARVGCIRPKLAARQVLIPGDHSRVPFWGSCWEKSQSTSSASE